MTEQQPRLGEIPDHLAPLEWELLQRARRHMPHGRLRDRIDGAISQRFGRPEVPGVDPRIEVMERPALTESNDSRPVTAWEEHGDATHTHEHGFGSSVIASHDPKSCPYCQAGYASGIRTGRKWSMTYACGYTEGGTDAGDRYILNTCPRQAREERFHPCGYCGAGTARPICKGQCFEGRLAPNPCESCAGTGRIGSFRCKCSDTDGHLAPCGHPITSLRDMGEASGHYCHDCAVEKRDQRIACTTTKTCTCGHAQREHRERDNPPGPSWFSTCSKCACRSYTEREDGFHD